MIRYVLLSDGSSDRALLPILNDLLQRCHQVTDIQAELADFYGLATVPASLVERIFNAIELYEPNMIFIHRDAEKESLESREKEIQSSGLSGRRLSRLNTHRCIQQVPEFISDYRPLEQLSAYQHLKKQIEQLALK